MIRLLENKIAAILYRYADYKGVNVEVSTQLDFTDTDDIAGWAHTAVVWAQDNSIISGEPGNLFDPQGNVTRAEVAAVLYRYLGIAQAAPEPAEPTAVTGTESTTGTETGTEPATSTEPAAEPATATNMDTSKILVAYFSRTGNTKALANHIQELTGGDLFEIVPVNPYPTDYNECLNQASQELENDYRPALATQVEKMSGYDVIFVGYPIWYGNAPMTIRTFLDEYDLSGKTIVPFCTHGGSGLGQSVTAITSLCPDSTILDGLAVGGASAENARDTVSAWLKSLGV